MSEDNTTHSAVDAPNASATPNATGQNSAQEPELSDVLNEFVNATSSTPKKEDPPATAPAKKPSATNPEPNSDAIGALQNQIAYLTDRERAREEADQTRRFNEDMNVVLQKVRGDLNTEFFDDDFVRAWIDGQAAKNPQLAQAWVNRAKDPKGFERVVGALQSGFVKKYGKLPDPNLTEDREAVSAAVRGASTKTPEAKPPKTSGMSDPEYRDYVEKTYGYRPNA
jgi:hypothetical protein